MLRRPMGRMVAAVAEMGEVDKVEVGQVAETKGVVLEEIIGVGINVMISSFYSIFVINFTV